MTTPRLSICLVTYNRAARLKENLDDLLSEDVPGREIVVVDGGSKDGTRALLESYGDRVRWISERDSGEYDAWNKTMKLARGDILKWLPDDDRLRHGASRLALDYFDAHPDVDLLWAQAQLWIEDEHGVRTQAATQWMTDGRRLTREAVLRQRHGLNSIGVFIRKSAVDRLGPFRLDLTCADTEYWVRALDRGTRTAVIPDVLVDYVLTGTNGVITKNWQLSRDVLRINLEYGTPRDVAWTVWDRRGSLLGIPALQHEVGQVAHRFGFHPLRTLRKVRARVMGR